MNTFNSGIDGHNNKNNHFNNGVKAMSTTGFQTYNTGVRGDGNHVNVFNNLENIGNRILERISVNFALIIALKEEVRYLIDMNLLEVDWDNYNRVNSVIIYPATGQDLGKCVLVISEQCMENSKHMTDAVLNVYHPKVLVSIGISGGLKDVKIRDVVVATEVDHFDHNTKRLDTHEEYQGKTLPTTRSISQLANSIGIEKKWHQIIAKKNAQESLPQLHVGPICCSNYVVDSTEFKKDIHQKTGNRKALCTDQESYGVLSSHAALLESVDKSSKNIDTLIIRGISDLCANKEDQQSDRKNAMTNAAMYLLCIAPHLITVTQ